MNFAYNGSQFRVQVGGKNILHEIDFNYGQSREFEELASKDVENEVNPGKKTYSLSGNGYADNSEGDAEEDIKALFAWQDTKTKKAFQIADGVTGNLAITGNAYLGDVEITSNNNEVVKYSFTLKVTDSTVGVTS